MPEGFVHFNTKGGTEEEGIIPIGTNLKISDDKMLRSLNSVIAFDNKVIAIYWRFDPPL